MNDSTHNTSTEVKQECNFFQPPAEENDPAITGISHEEWDRIVKKYENETCPYEGVVPIEAPSGKVHYLCQGHAEQVQATALLAMLGLI